MARPSSLKPTHRPQRAKKGLSAWVVNVPAELSPTGKRQQLFFATKTEAKTSCEKLHARKDNFGISLSSMTASRVAAAAEAYNLLDPHKIDLLDAVREHLKAVAQRSGSVTFGEVFDRFADLKKNKSVKYQQELRHAKATFSTLLGRLVCEISTEDLEPALNKLPASSRNAKMRRLRSVFNFAIKRGWLQLGASPIARLDFSEQKKKEVEVFATEEVERMLCAALENDIDLVPFFTLAVFCGIRPDGELQKLEWSDLKFEGKPQIVIRPEVSKINRRRFVDISMNAIAWIEAYRQSGGSTAGKIVPFNRDVLRKKRRRNRVSANISRWIQDGLRHTFCSAWLAEHKDVNELVLQSGHTDPDTMWKHYHRAIPEAEAKKFWAIMPPVESENVIAFAQA
jgi:integrase